MPFAEEDQAPKCSSVKVVNDWPFLLIRSHVRLGPVIQWVSGSGKTPGEFVRNH